MKLRMKVDEQTFEVEVGDLSARPVRVAVDGETFEVWPEEAGAVLPAPPGRAPVAVATPPPALVKPFSAGAPANHTKAVLAPIPGVIISISIKEGEAVAVGQELCVLEAMKMKNSIRANRAGKICAVRVTPGEQVAHSQVLMEFAD